ncbi:3-oxoacyl-[acyl-carrier protein] reductase [Arcanobacterium wilhelmae]|uniref:3-oxoacyl-[acyl-carrier protein] reductase n=1 Tax=Arcanobacterium wilhelmae TaxID=1803177 RepID=A0ABT9NCJ8_9ACTO|nr:SDR family oxidoreductase [Arcanobacterium wilhelmae]MDP9801225.1 3-oxoacyl-[acyl-carrier protein] reductase [Arcanobacterium wilhelmae]WFN90574.1 SDR family NAD(P)-dependent oxidoreductase [Arcanobacterium wilhelmae]
MEYALVTGGSKGIGYAVARMLASRGYSLLVTYGHDVARAMESKTLLEEAGSPSVEMFEVDQTSPTAANDLVGLIGGRVSELCAVVLNAGVTLRENFGQIDPKHWEDVFAANIHFPTFFLQEIAPQLPKGASVVFTGSLMGVHPHGTSLAYGVTKSATHALVKNLVKFLSPFGVRVNGVAPGFVDTEWQKDKPAEIRASIESKTALGRFCTPEEVAGAYAFLLENPYMNGEILVIDGGYSYK